MMLITNFVGVRDNSGHVVPLICSRTLVKTTTMDPDANRELRIFVYRRIPDDIEGKTGFRHGVPDRIRLSHLARAIYNNPRDK